ncbi:Ubiquitin-protein ligase E3A [Astathelohania contejeani]|uniref:HECT-type E3 ubiquitin transferase n=1 Tax=Astathelohania contejeani TaxID=164912 RepID=A0ABQ7HVM4_9MICR|nr:Ubiquitin-protein ligase E3A [Thelohania contejeani]
MQQMDALTKKYINQLIEGCISQQCISIFCNKRISLSNAEMIAADLSLYGTIFQCDKIETILCPEFDSSKFQNRGCLLLDFFFFAISLEKKDPKIDEESCSQNEETRNTKKYILFDKQESTFNIKKINTELNNYSIWDDVVSKGDLKPETTQKIFHEYCEFLNQRIFTELDLFLLESIFILMNKKYNTNKSKRIGLCIIKIFNILTTVGHKVLEIRNLEKIYYDLKDFYDKIRNELDFDTTETKLTFQPECFLLEHITRDGFLNSFYCIKMLLDNHGKHDIWSDGKIECLLNIFKFLYSINDNQKILSYKQFYLENFCEKVNFTEEYRKFKTHTKSIFNYTFILPLRIKAELVKHENKDSIKLSLQDSFFRSLFEGKISPYLYFKVNRNTIYGDTIKFFAKLTEKDAKKQIRITFIGEEGVDSGGIRKEYFQLLSEQITNNDRLFDVQNNVLWIKMDRNSDTKLSSELLMEYEIIGKIIGIAFYNDIVLNIPFPKYFFKMLLKKTPEFKDLIDIYPDEYHSLCQLLKYNNDELKALEQNFVVPYLVEGKGFHHCLIENGEKTFVNADNINLFVQKYTEFLLIISIKDKLNSIKKGFHSVIKLKSINDFHSNELEKIIMGTEYIDVDAIKKYAQYSGYSDNDPMVKYFWDIFKDYSIEDKKKLLQFITGNDRIPISGPESINMIIIRNGCDTDRLPSSQTCFNTILIPEYSSKEKLKSKLDSAISMTKGFYLM